MIDIVDVKAKCKNGDWKSYVKDGIIYLRNEVGEVVMLGEVEEKISIKKVTCKYDEYSLSYKNCVLCDDKNNCLESKYSVV